MSRPIVRIAGLVIAALCLSVYADAASAEKAKNVILMISDGAGFNAFHAASYYQHGKLGQQPYDQFPVRLACTTYMLNYVDAQGNVLAASTGKMPAGAVDAKPHGYDPAAMWQDFNYCKGQGNYTAFTDSAAAATALYCGVKTTRGRMAMSWDAAEPLSTMAELADAAGKATGTISSVNVVHATPGAVWSHVASRNSYAEIFNEMLYRSGLDVIMGAGHPFYNNDGVVQYDQKGKPISQGFDFLGGKETCRDLSDSDGANGFRYLEWKRHFQQLAEGTGPDGGELPAKVVGIARAHDTIQFRRKGKAMAPEAPLNSSVPTLATMARGALNVLAQDPDGFFLMIEGGAVDWANHANNLPRMIEEQVDFNQAVQAVVDWVGQHSSWDETLLIVTSDHECGMLWGPGTYTDQNGNGSFDAGVDTFVAFKPIAGLGVGNVPPAQYGSKGHTNALVPLWAIGPGSQQFLQLVDGIDAKAGEFWGFSGKYVDNTDVFTVMQRTLTPAAVEATTAAAP